MVSLAMLVLTAGCAAFLYFKGTLVQGVVMVFNAVIAGFVAFGFHEMLARVLIKYSPGIAVWAPLICFALLFILTFAVLQTIAMQLGKEKADLGKLPEQIGRIACGVLLGYVVTGYLLVAVAMAPLPSKYPYSRFEERHPNPARPNKPMLSPDGFVTGLFATVSKGAFSAIGEPRSFAVLQAGYLDHLYLSRHKPSKNVPVMTKSPAVGVPPGGVRHAPDSLRDAEGKPLSMGAGENLMLVRIEMKSRVLADAGKFTLSQVRLICGPRGGNKGPLAGQGQAVYPIGWIGDGKRLERKGLDEIVTLKSSNDSAGMDLAFAVPVNLTPLLLGFKRNDVVQLPAPASEEDALEVLPFSTSAESSKEDRRQSGDERPSSGQTSSSESEGETSLSNFSRGIIADPIE